MGVCVMISFAAEVTGNILFSIRIDNMVELIDQVALVRLSVGSRVL